MTLPQQNTFIDCPPELQPPNTSGSCFDPETLRLAAEAHNRHGFDHSITVKAWVVLWLLDRAFPTADADVQLEADGTGSPFGV